MSGRFNNWVYKQNSSSKSFCKFLTMVVLWIFEILSENALMVFIGVNVLTNANLDNSSEQLNPKLFIELVSILLSADSMSDSPFFNEIFNYYLFLFSDFKKSVIKSHRQFVNFERHYILTFCYFQVLIWVK